MVNGHDAIAKGQHIEKTGLKPELLPPNSICMEINPSKRDAQLQANSQMCLKANGMLGEVLGSERFVTLGTSHFVMYCRALQQKAFGPEGTRMQPNPEFSELLQKGWQWVAICSAVEDAFPTFATWCQATLNSVNSASKMVGELEAMLQISTYLQQGHSIESAVALVKAAAPSCSHYLPDIAHFVRLFLGGSTFPLLVQLRDFCLLDASVCFVNAFPVSKHLH